MLAKAGEREVEVTRLAHERFTERNVDGIMELCSPDVTFATFLGQMEGRTYQGREGVREWLENLRETFSDFATECLAVEPMGGCVIADVLMSGTASGLRLEMPAFQVVRFVEGLANWWGWYRTREEALAVAGEGE